MTAYRATLFFVLLSFCALTTVSAQRRGISSRRIAEQATLQRILDPTSYDSRINPGGNNTNGPVEITVQIYTRAIYKIDDANNELGLQITMRQQWNDPRLVYNSRVGSDDLKYVTVQDLSKIWRADIFVANAKEENLHDFNKPNAFARIYPNGDILLSERVSLSIFCPMNLKNFPFDSQTCKIRLASYSSVNTDIVLTWRADDPLQASPDLNIQEFILTSFETDRCDANTTTGTYSCIVSYFHFQRTRLYYLVHIFIPCLMLSIVAYLVFWLEPSNLIPRLIISLASLFVAAIQISNFNKDLPKASQTKAVDNYTGTALTFVFVTLIETIVVYSLSRGEASDDPSKNGGTSPDDPEAENLKTEAEGGDAQKKTSKFRARNVRNYLSGIRRRSSRIDVLFRILYPIIFALFALVYVLVYAM
ncbi:unnamed protein product [Allacma fusca]|uniref:Glutamate-gated chloride channel n=1 Tax=Allacma fusca TaxID=39272 RepID=A0A8J2JK18_9HEXA|nr:unnamed protein product [Allacma fusca]